MATIPYMVSAASKADGQLAAPGRAHISICSSSPFEFTDNDSEKDIL